MRARWCIRARTVQHGDDPSLTRSLTHVRSSTPPCCLSAGIPSKIVQDAVSEVADDFNAYSRKRKTSFALDPNASSSSSSSSSSSALSLWLSHTRQQQEDDSSAYNVSLGQRYVLQSKYVVTFRMVDSIMVFYVAGPDSNPLISLRYVDAAAEIWLGWSKGVDN